MYVTGGIGPSADNEGFTDYYDLPNESAYAETCASVGLVFWASRMLGRGPNRRYADIMEQALYNGAMSGLSLDGKTFFYENPLESGGKHHRWIWHRCPCCPPNIARMLASIGSYMYAVSDDEIAVHLYGEVKARFEIAGVAVESGAADALSLGRRDRVRYHGRPGGTLRNCAAHPEWADGATLKVNGETVDLATVMVDGYARIDRDWTSGDHIDLDIPLRPRALFANPLVRQDAGRAALMRGPMVYCVEATDNGEGLNGIRLAGDVSQATTSRCARSAGCSRYGRLGEHALSRRATCHRAGHRAFCALSPLGQPRARGNAGLDQVGQSRGVTASGSGTLPHRATAARERFGCRQPATACLSGGTSFPCAATSIKRTQFRAMATPFMSASAALAVERDGLRPSQPGSMRSIVAWNSTAQLSTTSLLASKWNCVP
jgi:hypothetical protein